MRFKRSAKRLIWISSTLLTHTLVLPMLSLICQKDKRECQFYCSEIRKTSIEFVFINTSFPDERVILVKSCSSLEELPKNSTAIKADNNIKRYQRRPGTMNNCCLAYCVALFNVKFSKQTPKSVNFIENEERNDELPEDSYELDVIADPYYNENESTIANEDEEHFARDGSVLTNRKKQL